MRVLLVEDDAGMAAVVQQALVSQHYLVDVAVDGQAGWDLAEAFAYDLILLDLMLPRLDGIQFCQRLRTETHNSTRSPNRHTPTLLITAQSASTDKVAALDAGADDYLVKPFDLDELLARVRALLRRGDTVRSPLLTCGQVRLDPSTGEVTIAGQPIHLSAKEYNLLELFLRAPKRIFSHSYLIEHLWALEEVPTENAVRAQIKGLRKKLKEAGAAGMIETIYGLGYRLQQERREVWEREREGAEGKAVTEDSVQNVACTLFAQHRVGYCERLAVIEQAVLALRQQGLSAELQQRACREAHTLKGSLGLFELNEASQLALEIEQMWRQQATERQLSNEQIQRLEHRVSELKNFLASDRPFMASENIVCTPPYQSATLWLIGTDQTDQALVDEFIQAAAQPLQIELMTDAEVGDRLTQAQPDAILLLLTTAEIENWAWLKDFSSHQPSVPWFVIAATTETHPSTQLQQRIQIAQLGGKGFWQTPIAPHSILETILEAIQPVVATTAKILVVDDDLAILETLQHILLPWGFEVTGLNDPQQFWGILEQVQPDLVILDIEMPEVSGIELCQVIRQDLQWNELPVLFLSAHTDDATLQKIFTVGADDYVSKPVRSVELVLRVLRRLEQARLLKRLHQRRTK